MAGLGVVWGQVILRRAARIQPKREQVPDTSPSYLWIKGRVQDAKTKEPLVGAYVRVPSTVIGAVTRAQGEFELPTTLREPIEVEISYVGYETKRITLSPKPKESLPEIIPLQEQEIIGQEVVIAASRIEEKQMHSPVQVFSLSGVDLRTQPGLFSTQAAAFLPGLEVVHSSLTFPVVNARGFAFTQNGRFIQRVDGVELLSVGLSIPVWVFSGAADIDIANTEVVLGPVSSLYGPNAFNGVMLTTLKDPFQYPGFSAQVRAGINHIGSQRSNPAPFYELQARYAYAWRNRFGLKVVLYGMQGQDWWATDTTDRGTYGGATPPFDRPGSQNPGYIPVNGNGYDARIFVRGVPAADNSPLPAFYLSRTGYLETDLIEPRTYALKLSAEASYRFSERWQGKVHYHIATGQTFFQTHMRYMLKDFVYQLYRAELTHPRGFIRLYTAQENAGRTSNMIALGANALASVKSHRDWFVQYILAYGGYIDAVISPADRAAFEQRYGREVPKRGDHAAARWLADNDVRFLGTLPSIANLPGVLQASWEGEARPAPNSPRLRQIVDSLTRVPISRGGAQLPSNSAFYHAEAQYELPTFAGVRTIVGGSVRLFEIYSQGAVFIDSGGKPLYNWETGAYLQSRRTFWNDRLEATVGIRYDYRQYLYGFFSPRIALSARIDKQEHHILRVALQRAFRNPVMDALFIRLPANFLLIGAWERTDKQYGIAGTNNYTASSVEAYRKAREQGLSPEKAAQYLKSLPLVTLRPEKVTSLELGSRHLLLESKMYLDLTYAHQWYRDFQGYVRLYGPNRPNKTLTPDDVEKDSLSTMYGRYYNIPSLLQGQFATVAISYRLFRYLALQANYSFSRAIGLDQAVSIDPSLYVFFNSSPHRISAGLILQNLGRWEAQLWYQWVNAFRYDYTTFSGIVPTYALIHAQVSYKIERWHSVVRIGAQNLLNFYHIEVAGGPRIGGLYYLQYALNLADL
ncbi:MAG: carboxypeptidase-like regulatory domain-containing protein [Bacteroidia bacterium]|nr:carboxypeptidase-like regulatory domain-containing protein [Bacteroidia bacterium]